MGAALAGGCVTAAVGGGVASVEAGGGTKDAGGETVAAAMLEGSSAGAPERHKPFCSQNPTFLCMK